MCTRGYQKESLISQGVPRNDQLKLELVNIPHYPGEAHIFPSLAMKDTDHGNMENGPFSLLIYRLSMVIFHWYVTVYQRVPPSITLFITMEMGKSTV